MISENDSNKWKQRNFVRKNLLAIVVLNTAFSKYPQYLTLIRNNRTPEWPSGRAWFIMETLRQKFLPRDGLTHFDAKKMLSEVYMHTKEEPIEFKDRLIDVQCRYPQNIKDLQVMNQFLRGCDGKYKDSILQIYRDNPDIDIYALSDILQIGHPLSEALEANLSLSTDPETLLTQNEGPPLSSSDTSDKNKVCYNCGMRGHLARNCPGKNGIRPGAMKCDLCDRYGHRRELCWEHSRNAHRRPEGWRSILPSPKDDDDDDDAALVSFSLMSIEDTHFLDENSLPVSVSPIYMSDSYHAHEEYLHLQQVGSFLHSNEVRVIPENENINDEDEVTILLVSDAADAANTILHLRSDAFYNLPDDVSLPDDLPALVDHEPHTAVNRLLNARDVVFYRPFLFPDVDYRVPPTVPIPFPLDAPVGGIYSWCMTRYSYRQDDVTRTGSPTNIVKESVFLASSENETNDEDTDNQDLGPTVLPYAYASPEVYSTPRESQSFDFDSSEDDMSFEYHPSSPESDEDTLSIDYTNVGDEVALLKAPGDTPATPIDLTCPAEDVINLTSLKDEDMPSATQVDSVDTAQLFSDTSDDNRTGEASQRPPVARVLDIPADEEASNKHEWDINEDQAFLSLSSPDACIFTDQAMAFGQPPLVQDAAQRFFNHLYLEEEIARN